MENTFTKSGFTLLEAIFVICLLSLFVSLELPANTSTYISNIRRTDQQLIVSALRKARSDALHDICQNPSCNQPTAHGIFLTQAQLIIFEGNSYHARYVPADITMSFLSPEIQTASTSTEIVFAAGTGDVSSNVSMSVIGPDHHLESISVNTEGMISP